MNDLSVDGAKYTSGRITRSYADLSGAYRAITGLCGKLVIYEHTPGRGASETAKVHTHFVATHMCDVKTIKNNIKKNLPSNISLDGNKDWKMSEWDGHDKAIVYMSKGILDPVYEQNVDLSGIKQQWVEQIKPVIEIPKSQREYSELIDEHWKSQHPLYNISDDADCTLHHRFNKVRKYFFTQIKSRRVLMNPAFFRDIKTYTMTFCFDEGIAIPRQKDAWENYE